MIVPLGAFFAVIIITVEFTMDKIAVAGLAVGHCKRHCGGRRSYLCEGYRAKTRVPVNVVIPHDVGDALRQLPNSHPSYFFWSGNGDPRSAAKAFQRSYWKLFRPAKILKPDGTPKRFHPHRDTIAVERLLAGVPLDQVSLLLGHSSVKITERHYAPFFKGRQEQLAASVKLAWKTPIQSFRERPRATRNRSTA
jgi:integrase